MTSWTLQWRIFFIGFDMVDGQSESFEDETLHTSLQERQTDLQEEPPALYTGAWERRWPAGWRSSGLHPAPACWICQWRPRTDLGRCGAKCDKFPPAAWSGHPVKVRRETVHCVAQRHQCCLEAFKCLLTRVFSGCVRDKEIIVFCSCACVFFHCITHLSPFFWQQVLQSLDEKNAEGTFCCGLHLIDTNTRGS